jgi:hypothetical protein
MLPVLGEATPGAGAQGVGYRKSGHWGLKNMQERAAQISRPMHDYNRYGTGYAN